MRFCVLIKKFGSSFSMCGVIMQTEKHPNFYVHCAKKENLKVPLTDRSAKCISCFLNWVPNHPTHQALNAFRSSLVKSFQAFMTELKENWL